MPPVWEGLNHLVIHSELDPFAGRAGTVGQASVFKDWFNCTIMPEKKPIRLIIESSRAFADSIAISQCFLLVSNSIPGWCVGLRRGCCGSSCWGSNWCSGWSLGTVVLICVFDTSGNSWLGHCRAGIEVACGRCRVECAENLVSLLPVCGM